jgi:YD repeat-containing protein
MQLEARCKALLESALEEFAVDETATRMAETFSRALLQAADELFGKVAEAHREQLKTQAQFFEIKLSHSRKASQMTLKEKLTTLESSHSRHLVETVQSVQAGGNEALEKMNSELEAERAKVQQLLTKLSLAEGDVQRFITQYRATDAKAKAAAAELARAQADLQAAGALLHDATKASGTNAKASGTKVVSSASSSSEASIAEQLRRLLDATGETISKLERRLAEQERAYADAQRELSALARGPDGLQEELRTARRQREEIASSLADYREMAEAAAVGAARELERLQSESSRLHMELEQLRVAGLVLVRELGMAERAWHEAVATFGAFQREASAREHAWQTEAERLQRACDVQAALQLETRQMLDHTSEKLLDSQSQIIELKAEAERESTELRAEIDELVAARAAADAASEAAAAEAAANLAAALAAAASGAGAVGASQREAIELREEIRRLTIERDALLADTRAVSGAIDEGMAALDLGGVVVVVGVGGGGRGAGSGAASGGAASALGVPPPTTGAPTKPSSGGGFADFRALARGESAVARAPRSETHDDEQGDVSGVHSRPTLERVRAVSGVHSEQVRAWADVHSRRRVERVRAWAEAHAAERRERSDEKAQLLLLQEQTRERVRELEDQLVALRAKKPVVVEPAAACRVCAAASQNALRLQEELSRAINEGERLRAALEEQTARSAEWSTAAAKEAEELKLKWGAAENALATTLEELERVSEALELEKSRSQAESSSSDVDARIKEERAAFKEERERLIQAALRALQQLRVYLSESLCGLRAPPPLSHTHDGAVLGLTRPRGRTTSQTWHRWGAITSEADMGALVVRLEAPAAPPLGVRPVPLVHHQLPMPHEGARLPGAGGVMTSSLSDPLLRRRLHPKRSHKLADQMSTTTTTHLRRAETADEPLGRARAIFDPTETEQGRRTASLPPVRPYTHSSPLRGTTLNPSSPLKSPSSPLKMEVKIRMSGPTPLERQLEPWSPSSP